MSKRIVLSATERGELVLRLLRKEATAGELAREAGISEPTLYQWRDTFLKAGFSGLDGRKSSDSEHRRLEREVAQRDQLIGEMTVALRTLKKVWASPIDGCRASLYPVRDGLLARDFAVDFSVV
ncbi:MAG: helix-turn-helix domain-containing protein [Gammaproteobacteria bacterium]|nr:helix-turn-helix domain-containing protein [Gammaproteobacteria bacterium]